MEIDMAESLRDQLAANYDKITAEATVDTETPAETVTPAAAPPSSKIVEAPKHAAAATPAADDRPRDAEGKFIAKTDAPKEEIKTAAKIHKAATPAPGS